MDNYGLSGVSLPFNLEAERSVLGAILIEPRSIARVADSLLPEHFYQPQHREIYAALTGMFQLSHVIDVVTALDELKTRGVYDEAGGSQYLLELAQFVPTAANIETYARIVREKAVLRSLIEAGQSIVEDASAAASDVATLLDSAEQRIYEIRQGREISGLRPIKDIIINETFDRLVKITSPETRDDYIGIPTGIGPLDRAISGLNKSDLLVLGARPGMGKTSLALNIAQHVALNRHKTVCYFSLEMTRDQLAQRLLSGAAGIRSDKFRSGDFTPDDWVRLVEASDALAKMSMYFDESTGLTVPAMKAKLRRLRGVDFAIVDYLQLMHSPGRVENRVQEVSEITRELKIMAKDLNIPVLLCAQLNRATDKQKDKRPQLADLRESGSIEQDADIVLFLYRQEYYNRFGEDEETESSQAELLVAKNRHGETPVISLNWQGEYTRFTAVEYAHS